MLDNLQTIASAVVVKARKLVSDLRKECEEKYVKNETLDASVEQSIKNGTTLKLVVGELTFSALNLFTKKTTNKIFIIENDGGYIGEKYVLLADVTSYSLDGNENNGVYEGRTKRFPCVNEYGLLCTLWLSFDADSDSAKLKSVKAYPYYQEDVGIKVGLTSAIVYTLKGDNYNNITLTRKNTNYPEEEPTVVGNIALESYVDEKVEGAINELKAQLDTLQNS